jgi:hypothetical protein
VQYGSTVYVTNDIALLVGHGQWCIMCGGQVQNIFQQGAGWDGLDIRRHFTASGNRGGNIPRGE